MNRDAINCLKCGLEVTYERYSCPSGHFAGFPNVRFAASMEEELFDNYRVALEAAHKNGTAEKLAALQEILRSSVATINVSPSILRNIVSGTSYSSYYAAVSEGLKRIAKAEYHGHRRSVDGKIHTGYEEQIINAQLSALGRGLANYGSVSLILKEVAIIDRTSVLRENAFQFFERYSLGNLDASEEAGWRAIWTNRDTLGVAHLAPSVTPATPTEKLADLVATPGSDRRSDRFIEVHIFGRIDWQAIERAVLETSLTEPDDRTDWDFSSEKLGARGIVCVDLST